MGFEVNKSGEVRNGAFYGRDTKIDINNEDFDKYLDEQLKAAYGGAQPTAYVSPPSTEKGGSIYGFGPTNT